LAITVLPEVPLSPEEGDQAYVDAPLAVRVVDCPEHIVTLVGLIVTTGLGFTVIAIVAELLHPADVPITV